MFDSFFLGFWITSWGITLPIWVLTSFTSPKHHPYIFYWLTFACFSFEFGHVTLRLKLPLLIDQSLFCTMSNVLELFLLPTLNIFHYIIIHLKMWTLSAFYFYSLFITWNEKLTYWHAQSSENRRQYKNWIAMYWQIFYSFGNLS